MENGNLGYPQPYLLCDLANPQTIVGVKTLQDGSLILQNPAKTAGVLLKSGAQTFNRTFTFPVSSINQTIAVLNLAQTFANTTTFSTTVTVNGSLNANSGIIVTGGVISDGETCNGQMDVENDYNNTGSVNAAKFKTLNNMCRVVISSSTTNTGLTIEENSTPKWTMGSNLNSFSWYNEQISSVAFGIGPTNDCTFYSNLSIATAGAGLYIKQGTNATFGQATLVAGTVVVSTTKVTANSAIFITLHTLGGIAVPAAVQPTARTAATSFTITSANALDTSTYDWVIIEPA